MTVTAIHLQDGTDIEAADVTCAGCGNPMSDHSCGLGGGSVTYTSGRSGKGIPRKPASAKPRCPHCGGTLHNNESSAGVNGSCLNRQYSLDVGDMTDPDQTLPQFTLERMADVVAWAEGLAVRPSYGKMESAAGGAGTYAAIRPKTGRKKKVVAAAPGSQIQDIAEQEAANLEAPTKSKKSKSKKSKGIKVTRMSVGEDGAVQSESVDAEITDGVLTPVDEIPTNGVDEEYGAALEDEAVEATSDEQEATEFTPVTNVEDVEAARAARAEQRRLRKEKMAAGSH